MNTQYVENQDPQNKYSTYPLAYSHAKNVFIEIPVMTIWEGSAQYRIEEEKI